MDRLLRICCAVSLLLVAGMSTAFAQPPDPTDPLLAPVPPQAVAVFAFDLRPETESVRVLATAQSREQAELLNALLLLGLQAAVTQAAPGLDVEKDVLPLLTRRAALCIVRVEGQRERPVILLELTGGTVSGAGFDRFVQAGVKGGVFAPAQPIDGVPAWQAQKRPDGMVMARAGSIVLMSDSPDTLRPFVQRMRTPGPPAPAVQALAAAPDGLARLGVSVPPGEAKGLPGVTAAAASLRLSAGGLVAEGVIPVATAGNQGPWAALAMLKPTFGESVSAVPESAAAVVVAARPSVIFQSFGVPFVDALAGGFIGPDPMKPLAKAAAPFLSDALAQEVAVGLFPSEKGLGWLGVLTSSRPEAVRAQVDAVAQAGQGARGLQWTPAPLGADPAWQVRAALKQGAPPFEMHVGLVGQRLLLASSRPILEAAATTARGEAGSVAKAEWYTAAVEKLGPNPILRVAADVKAVGRVAASFAAAQGKITPRYATRAADALLAAFGALSAGVRVEGAKVQGTLQVGVDYQKLGALGGAFPAVGALLVGVAVPARSAATGARGNARQAACLNNVKQLAMAAMLYAQDWGKLPPAVGWADVLEPYFKEKAILRCPADTPEHACSYAFNSSLSELPLAQVKNPAQTVLFYETTAAERSPAGTGAGMPAPARHDGKHVFAFVDGHAEAMPQVDPAWFKAVR